MSRVYGMDNRGCRIPLVVYVDGVLEKDQALAGPPMENNVPFRIGRGEGTAYQFHGFMDGAFVRYEYSIHRSMAKTDGLQLVALMQNQRAERLLT